MGLVVDTSALVDAERDGLDVAEMLSTLSVPGFIPAIVYAELLVGVELAAGRRRRERREKLTALAAVLPVVDFGREIAERWAQVAASLRRRRQMIPGNDLQVAATALVLEFDVLVGRADEAHFRRVRGLRVESLPD